MPTLLALPFPPSTVWKLPIEPLWRRYFSLGTGLESHGRQKLGREVASLVTKMAGSIGSETVWMQYLSLGNGRCVTVSNIDIVPYLNIIV